MKLVTRPYLFEQNSKAPFASGPPRWYRIQSGRSSQTYRIRPGGLGGEALPDQAKTLPGRKRAPYNASCRDESRSRIRLELRRSKGAVLSYPTINSSPFSMNIAIKDFRDGTPNFRKTCFT